MMKKTQRIKERLHESKPVYAATFTFRIKTYDAAFERLNSIIDGIANANPGFLGKEQWANDKEHKKSVVYYWKSLQALKKFSNHPDHKEAKRNYKKWYEGYEIMIAEVINFKYDGNLK